jgi:hypothetical protein
LQVDSHERERRTACDICAICELSHAYILNIYKSYI